MGNYCFSKRWESLTKCQFWTRGVDGSDSQSLSDFYYEQKEGHQLTFCHDILSGPLSQHFVISWNGVVHSHIEHFNNVLHHISDLWDHLCFAVLDHRASFLVDCLHVGHFAYRILLGEVQTLRLESSKFWMCHL